MKNILICLLLTFVAFNAFSQTGITDSTSNEMVVIQKFDPVIATQEYLDTLSGEAKEKSDSYFEGGYWLLLWNVLYSIGVALIFLSFGLSSWIKKIATRMKNVNLQNLIYIIFYMIFFYLLFFPLNIYENFFREHQYNLSNLTFGAWIGEEMKSLLVSIIFMSLILMIIYKLVRKVQQKWWLWAGFVSIVFLVIGLLIAPVFISPLFNEYQPMEEGHAKEEILSLARANQIPADDIYQFDASKQSNRISANVSGFANTTRISLNDNLLNRCDVPEIKAVMAHEMGHYVLNHIYEMLVYFGLILLIGFAFVNWSFLKIISSKWGAKWQIDCIADIKGLPLFAVLFTVFMFFATPVINNIIRSNEVEADMFGLNTAREPDGFASCAMKLSEYRKINPGKWEEIIFFDHPSGKTRVWSAMKWKSENLEE